jgi:hypothetical protein
MGVCLVEALTVVWLVPLRRSRRTNPRPARWTATCPRAPGSRPTSAIGRWGLAAGSAGGRRMHRGWGSVGCVLGHCERGGCAGLRRRMRVDGEQGRQGLKSCCTCLTLGRSTRRGRLRPSHEASQPGVWLRPDDEPACDATRRQRRSSCSPAKGRVEDRRHHVGLQHGLGQRRTRPAAARKCCARRAYCWSRWGLGNDKIKGR